MSRILLAIIRIYVMVSPSKPVSCCRFLPTCSDYATQAILAHGALKGGWLAFRRIIRCNPLVKHGIDEVP